MLGRIKKCCTGSAHDSNQTTQTKFAAKDGVILEQDSIEDQEDDYAEETFSSKKAPL